MAKKSLMSFMVFLLLILFGCSHPVYLHSITHNYDANGNLIGVSETESISQMEPSPTPMKVKVTQKEKIEN